MQLATHGCETARPGAEREITIAYADLTSSEQTLEDALTVAGACQRHYETAQLYQTANQSRGFFRKLIINSDRTVNHAEPTEPFAQLLHAQTAKKATRDIPHTPWRRQAFRTGETPQPPLGVQGTFWQTSPQVGRQKPRRQSRRDQFA